MTHYATIITFYSGIAVSFVEPPGIRMPSKHRIMGSRVRSLVSLALGYKELRDQIIDSNYYLGTRKEKVPVSYDKAHSLMEEGVEVHGHCSVNPAGAGTDDIEIVQGLAAEMALSLFGPSIDAPTSEVYTRAKRVDFERLAGYDENVPTMALPRPIRPQVPKPGYVRGPEDHRCISNDKARALMRHTVRAVPEEKLDELLAPKLS